MLKIHSRNPKPDDENSKVRANGRSPLRAETRNFKPGTIEYGRTAVRPYGLQKGVTLVEMAVVVGILLILAAVAVPEIYNLVERGRRQNAIDGAAALAGAVEMYRTEDENDKYPPVGSILPLAKYEEVTRYADGVSRKGDVYDESVTVAAGGKGVAIYTDITNTPQKYACIYGIVNNITPAYKVTHCVKTDNTWTQRQDTQPTCCWAKGGVDCSEGSANWYPCKSKM